MIALFSAAALAFAGVLLLARFVRGPSPVDRVLAAHGVLVCAALIAATLALYDTRWIDAALALVLLGAVLVVAAVKVLVGQGGQSPLAQLDERAGT
jgi:multisubunit Na+/H+ antiporter MnhF subunit